MEFGDEFPKMFVKRATPLVAAATSPKTAAAKMIATRVPFSQHEPAQVSPTAQVTGEASPDFTVAV